MFYSLPLYFWYLSTYILTVLEHWRDALLGVTFSSYQIIIMSE